MTDLRPSHRIRDRWKSRIVQILWVALISLSASPLMAQNSHETEFQVVQLAGNQVYLEWQEELPEADRPVQGVILFVFRDGELLGELKILAVSAPRLVATMESEPFELTRGEFVVGRWDLIEVPPETEQEVPVPADSADSTGKGSILDRPVQERVTRQSTPDRYRISGRVTFGGNLSRSETKWSSVLNEKDIRWSSLPYTNLNVRAQDREQNFTVQIQGRYSYRLQTNSRINQTGIMNIYRVSLTKQFERVPLQVQAGRFYNRYENTNPYWDGVQAEYSVKNFSAGVLSGWEPRRSSEGLRTSFPKAGLFLTHRGSAGQLRWNSQANATSFFPKDFETHHVIGLEQFVRYQPVSIRSEYQMDYSESDKKWKQTRLRINGSIDLTKWLQIEGYYFQRTPFLLEANPSVYLSTRTRFGGEIQTRFSQWALFAGVTVNDRSSEQSYTYSGRIQWRDSPVWQIDWSAYGSYFDSVRGSSWNTGLYASKAFTFGSFSTGLSTYRSMFGLNDSITASFHLNGSFELENNLALTTQLQTSYGDLLSRNAVSVSLTKRF